MKKTSKFLQSIRTKFKNHPIFRPRVKKTLQAKTKPVTEPLAKAKIFHKLSVHITAVVLLALFAVMAAIYAYLNLSLSDVLTKNAQKNVEMLAEQNAAEVSEFFGAVSAYADSLSIFMGRLSDGGLDKPTFSKIVQKTLKDCLNDDRIDSVYVAWVPNLIIDNTPTGLSFYVYRDGAGVTCLTGNDYAVYSTMEAYNEVQSSGVPHFSEPYANDMAGGKSVVTVSYPITNGTGTFVGAVCCNITVEKLSALGQKTGDYTSAYSYILTNSGTLLSHSRDASRVGTVYGSDAADTDVSEALAAVKNGEALFKNDATSIAGNPAYIFYRPISLSHMDTSFSSAFAVETSEAYGSRDAMLRNVLLLILGGVAVMFLATFLNIFRLVSPVKKIVKVTESLKKGDLNITESVKQKNEFGTIFNAICGVSDTLNELVEDTNSLTQAALSGNLAYRADPEKHQGAYKEILEGINSTLDAVIEPVNEASNVLVELSQGRLDIAVEGDYKGDYATIKHALNDTIETLRGYIGELSELLSHMASGDFNIAITGEYRGEFLKLKTSVNTIADSMSAVLSDIRTAADQVSAGTRQVSAGGQAISQGATEQASAIEQLTASISAIAGQTRENAVGATKASELSGGARARALGGSEHMEKLQNAMAEINEASSSIGKIIKVIDDIAFQTNILALNAAVEAARAGIHGKGFAVVAEEVRNLAGKSAQAAKETTALIESSVKKAEVGSMIADETAEELKRIVEAVEASAKLVSDIAAASNEQATAISQVNRGIEQMSQVVQTNSATAEEQAATSEELSGQAEMLRQQVSQFIVKEATAPQAKQTNAPQKQARPAQSSKDIRMDGGFGKYSF